MGKVTKIAWTDHTFSPWWGCSRVAPECQHCYAEAFAKRTGWQWGPAAERRLFGAKHWAEPLKWNAEAARDGVRRKVFCASMADVFEDRPELEPERQKLWKLVDETPSLDWLLLTKRPENIRSMMPLWIPLANVWLGTSGGTQKTVDSNLDYLLAAPAVVHFLSAEPLLEPIDIADWIDNLDWVITGAESGPKARPMDDDWVRVLRDECQRYGTAFFFKQRVDARGNKLPEPELDGRQWREWPNMGGAK